MEYEDGKIICKSKRQKQIKRLKLHMGSIIIFLLDNYFLARLNKHLVLLKILAKHN